MFPRLTRTLLAYRCLPFLKRISLLRPHDTLWTTWELGHGMSPSCARNPFFFSPRIPPPASFSPHIFRPPKGDSTFLDPCEDPPPSHCFSDSWSLLIFPRNAIPLFQLLSFRYPQILCRSSFLLLVLLCFFRIPHFHFSPPFRPSDRTT